MINLEQMRINTISAGTNNQYKYLKVSVSSRSTKSMTEHHITDPNHIFLYKIGPSKAKNSIHDSRV